MTSAGLTSTTSPPLTAPRPSAVPRLRRGSQGPPGDPVFHRHWRRAFPGRSSEVPRLRRWLARLLPPEAPAAEDVVMIAVELATNAVKHSASGCGGTFTVEITYLARPAAVWVDVSDDGAPTGPAWSAHPDSVAGHGLGLYLVRALASRTGVSGDHRGRRVWAEVPWPSGVPKGAVPPHRPCQASSGPDAGLDDVQE